MYKSCITTIGISAYANVDTARWAREKSRPALYAADDLRRRVWSGAEAGVRLP